MALASWPELSRKPALKTKRKTSDPTMRDPMESGAEASRLRFPRGRREWDVTIDALTPADLQALDDFVTNVAEYGNNPFLFTDDRDPTNIVTLTVRFSKIPDLTDAGNVEAEFRQNVTFSIREL